MNRYRAEIVLRLFGWVSLLALLVSTTGFLLAGVLPFPLGPDDSVSQVVTFYSRGAHVAMGLGLTSLGLGALIPVIAAISYIMWQDGTRVSPFALLQLVSGTITIVCLMLPIQIMAVAGFRPDRPGDLTMLLNDLSWLMFITPIAPFIIQNVAVGAGILSDNRSLFPRWLGYLSLWVGFTFTFDIVAFAFHGGPMAWNGMLIFWLALTSYSIWVVAMIGGIQVASRKIGASADHRDKMR